MNTYMVIVTYIIENGKRDAFVSEVVNSKVIDLIRNEEGCLSYNYYHSIDDCNQLLLVEKWNSLEEQQQHLKQSHMNLLKEIKNKYVTQTFIETALIQTK